MDELKREVIFAVSQMKEFERFLKSDLKYCVLMDIHLALLASMVKAAHEQEKKVFFHLDPSFFFIGYMFLMASTVARSHFFTSSTSSSFAAS